jgi:hypothetical protein
MNSPASLGAMSARPAFPAPGRALAHLLAVAAVVASAAAVPVRAQPIIPNPLIQPAPAAAAASAAASQGPAAGQPPAQGGARGTSPSTSARALDSSSQSPLPPGADAAEPPSIPLAVQERVSGLYVAAIVDRSAVLRSQLAVPQMVFASAGGAGAVSAGNPQSQGQALGGGGGNPGAGGAAGIPSTGPTVYRSISYVVRDGQVVDFIDRYRILARVTRDTVVLYLMPEKGARADEAKVVFRGSIDSVIAAPPVPSRSLLEAPDGGLDGKSRRELADVASRSGGVTRGAAGGSVSPTNNSGGTAPAR